MPSKIAKFVGATIPRTKPYCVEAIIDADYSNNKMFG
jgi:hypothetical protein